jgi:hypothetical protein
MDDHPGVRVRPEEKGGRTAVVTGGTKPADHRFERRQPIAKLVGDGCQRSLFDKVSAQGFVAAMTGVLGLNKELAAAGVVHDGVSKWLIIFGADFVGTVYDTSDGAAKRIRRSRVKKPSKRAIGERTDPLQGPGSRGSEM